MANAAIVQTDSGPVRGTVTGEYRLFQGVPYAASTAGELRWRSPQPVRPWTGPRDATRPGRMCPQQPSSYADVASLDEDCLCLNVITPRAARPPRRRPVMVWIHGDGAIGAGSFFDARRLATIGDVMVVTINYRLGIFGAFGYPGLEDSGTFGLQDQQAALRWVARNAAAFGGDPGNVTVFGESYGGLSTSAHLVAPGSAGLFHRAIIQSGFALMDLPGRRHVPRAARGSVVRVAGGRGGGIAGRRGGTAAGVRRPGHGNGLPAWCAGTGAVCPCATVSAVWVRQPRAARGPGPGTARRPLPPGTGHLRRHPRRAPAVCRPVPRAGRRTGHRTAIPRAAV